MRSPASPTQHTFRRRKKKLRKSNASPCCCCFSAPFRPLLPLTQARRSCCFLAYARKRQAENRAEKLARKPREEKKRNLGISLAVSPSSSASKKEKSVGASTRLPPTADYSRRARCQVRCRLGLAACSVCNSNERKAVKRKEIQTSIIPFALTNVDVVARFPFFALVDPPGGCPSLSPPCSALSLKPRTQQKTILKKQRSPPKKKHSKNNDSGPSQALGEEQRLRLGLDVVVVVGRRSGALGINCCRRCRFFLCGLRQALQLRHPGDGHRGGGCELLVY